MVFGQSLQVLILQVLVCLAIFSFASCDETADPNPQCTKSRIGLPACNFDIKNCYKEDMKDGETQAWMLTGQDGPVKPRTNKSNDKYVYLENPSGKKEGNFTRQMKASISKITKAICVSFYYLSNGSEPNAINIYLRRHMAHKKTADIIMHEISAPKTDNWQTTDFACCLPDVDRDRDFVIEGSASPGGLVALDFMDIRVSNMSCDNDRLVCYPRPPSQGELEASESAPTCSADAKSSPLSCDFETSDRDSPDFCGWTASPGWLARQKKDGSGEYDTILANQSDAGLVSQTLRSDVHSLCVEVQFATNQADLTGVFSLYVFDKQTNQSTIWGESHNYEKETRTEWKRNIFQGCLPDISARQIILRAKTDDLRIDHIYMKESVVEKCLPTAAPVEHPSKPTDESSRPGEPEKEPEVLLSCSSSSPLLECGLFFSPSTPMWTQITKNSTGAKRVFPGVENYVYVRSSGKELGDVLSHRAAISTGILKAGKTTKMQFRLNLQGPVNVAVRTLNTETKQEKEVWRSDQDTNDTWVSQDLPVEMEGKIQIMFEIIPSNATSSEEFTVGFTDIFVRTGVSDSTEGEGEGEGEGQGEGEGGPKDTDVVAREPEEKNGSGVSSGAIVGAVIAVLAVVILIGGAVWYFYFRGRSENLGGRYLEKSDGTGPAGNTAVDNVIYDGQGSIMYTKNIETP